MTLKTSKSAGKKSSGGKLETGKQQPGFTVAENFLIDQLEVKKKTKHAAKESDDSKKVGKMFKKKKISNVPDDEEENLPAPKTIKKVRKEPMEEDQGFEVVKTDDVVPGFAAPKVAKKRKVQDGNYQGGKKQKLNQEKKEVSKKELKVERKKKENAGRYDLSVKAKKLWEELRMEETPKDRQLALSAELFGLVKGHAKEVCRGREYQI